MTIAGLFDACAESRSPSRSGAQWASPPSRSLRHSSSSERHGHTDQMLPHPCRLASTKKRQIFARRSSSSVRRNRTVVSPRVRGYRSLGNCPDGAAPLMKPVVASAGDIVEVSSLGITVNGMCCLPNTAPKDKDSKGRPMQPWPNGQYRVPQGFVWVASSYNPWSFDSRYFGPLPVSIIRSHLKPFLTL